MILTVMGQGAQGLGDGVTWAHGIIADMFCVYRPGWHLNRRDLAWVRDSSFLRSTMTVDWHREESRSGWAWRGQGGREGRERTRGEAEIWI
jgi:hypothetical protein